GAGGGRGAGQQQWPRHGPHRGPGPSRRRRQGRPLMPNLSPAQVVAIIREEAAAAGLDPQLALAVANQERGFRDDAVGDNGHSVGAFQENDAGRGHGLSVAQRTDVRAQAQRFFAELKSVATRNAGISYGRLAALTQRPLDQAGYERAINAML